MNSSTYNTGFGRYSANHEHWGHVRRLREIYRRGQAKAEGELKEKEAKGLKKRDRKRERESEICPIIVKRGATQKGVSEGIGLREEARNKYLMRNLVQTASRNVLNRVRKSLSKPKVSQKLSRYKTARKVLKAKEILRENEKLILRIETIRNIQGKNLSKERLLKDTQALIDINEAVKLKKNDPDEIFDRRFKYIKDDLNNRTEAQWWDQKAKLATTSSLFKVKKKKSYKSMSMNRKLYSSSKKPFIKNSHPTRDIVIEIREMFILPGEEEYVLEVLDHRGDRIDQYYVTPHLQITLNVPRSPLKSTLRIWRVDRSSRRIDMLVSEITDMKPGSSTNLQFEDSNYITVTFSRPKTSSICSQPSRNLDSKSFKKQKKDSQVSSNEVEMKEEVLENNNSLSGEEKHNNSSNVTLE